MSRNLYLLLIAILITNTSIGQTKDSLSLVFIGDIMGHGSQIRAAYSEKHQAYDYTSVFTYVKPLLQKADVALGNLEVTLAGPPYEGYPSFSSPDALAEACKEAGLDILTFSNNHTYDRGEAGIKRTIRVLDSLDIPHTGAYVSHEDKVKRRLYTFEEKGFRIGLLNYTYATNDQPVLPPVEVDVLDTMKLLQDLYVANKMGLDYLVAFVHWGKEYQHDPSPYQERFARFLGRKGVNLIVGAHPHVVQPLRWEKTAQGDDYFVAYSLGNFVSNQRKFARDGGMMLHIELTRDKEDSVLMRPAYTLNWVNKPIVEGRRTFEVLPIQTVEAGLGPVLSIEERAKLNVFAGHSRKILGAELEKKK